MSELHPQNAESLIFVTLLGILILVSDLHLQYVDIAGYQLFVVNTIEEVERFFFGNSIIAEF